MYFGIAANDDMRQPDAKDKLKESFAAAKVPTEIEVYSGSQHGWCVPDMPAGNGMPIYNKPDARARLGQAGRSVQGGPRLEAGLLLPAPPGFSEAGAVRWTRSVGETTLSLDDFGITVVPTLTSGAVAPNVPAPSRWAGGQIAVYTNRENGLGRC